MLPLNLYFYSILSFDDNVADDINYLALFESIVVVILAISLGIYVSMNEDSHHFNQFANKASKPKIEKARQNHNAHPQIIVFS